MIFLLKEKGNFSFSFIRIINGFLAKLRIGRKASFKADVKQRPDNINLRKKTHQIQIKIHRVVKLLDLGKFVPPEANCEENTNLHLRKMHFKPPGSFCSCSVAKVNSKFTWRKHFVFLHEYICEITLTTSTC